MKDEDLVAEEPIDNTADILEYVEEIERYLEKIKALIKEQP